MIKRIIIAIYTFLLASSGFPQESKLKYDVNFYVNNKITKDLQCFIISKDLKEAYLLPKDGNQIVIKDTIKSERIHLLFVFKKHVFAFYFYNFKRSNILNIYFDNRFLNNSTKRKFRINMFKYLFKKEYYIDQGLDDFTTVFEAKRKIKLLETR